MNFKLYARQGRLIACSSELPCNYLIVVDVAADASMPADGEPIEGTVLFNLWNRASSTPVGGRRRAIHFFPSAEAAAIDAFCRDKISRRWGSFFYWEDITNSEERILPSTAIDVASVRQFRLRQTRADGSWPESLDDFAFVWHDDIGRLDLRAVSGDWTIDDGYQVLARSGVVHLDLQLDDPQLFPGGVAISVGTADRDRLPVGFSYHTVEPYDDGFAVKTVLYAEALVAREGTCDFVLDPRDESDFGATPMSRIVFHPDTKLVSTFVADDGRKVILHAADGAAPPMARLRHSITGGVYGPDGPLPGRPRDATFALEGGFKFAGVDGPRRAKAQQVDSFRILTGQSPTETTHVRVGDIFRFTGRQPAVFRQDAQANAVEAANAKAEAAIPPWMDDHGKLVTTSWLSIERGSGGNPKADDAAQFHSEPSTSPLFSVPGADHSLGRSHLKYGPAVMPMPVFPWAGLVAPAGLSKQDVAATVDYEAKYLAPARRFVVPRPAAKRVATDRSTTAKEQARAVTPQGMIAAVDASGDYSQLFFGRPSGVDEAPFEFAITLSAGSSAYEDIQRALRAEDLFFVVNDITADAQLAFQPLRDVRVGEFTLNLDIRAMGKSVLLIKYFRGKSLKDLVNDESLWACKQHLATATTKTHVTELAEKLKAGEVGYKAWQAIWEQPDWQGVVLLDFLPTGTPDLFGALGAGMDEDQFRFHHLGLNFLPVKSADLASAAPRVGSAFGLLRYVNSSRNDSRFNAVTNDNEPTDGDGSATEPKDRLYRFIVDRVSVLIQNGKVSEFDARARVGFSHLFWDKAKNGQANEIQLKGTYEARLDGDGTAADMFKLVADGSVASLDFADGSWLDKFVITSVELSVTSSIKATPAQRREIEFFIGFDGELKFDKSNQAFNNLFELESLSLERAGLAFTYRPAVEGGPGKEVKCAFRADSARANAKLGDPDSFLALLPFKVTGIRVAFDKLLDLKELNFLSFGGGSRFLFAIDLEIDMGFLGKLAGLGKGLKFPALLGWRKGSFGFGIQFPNWTGESFEIGIQQFVALRADEANIQRCPPNGPVRSIAFTLSKARVVLFGHEWPDEEETLSVGVFVDVGGKGKLAWLVGLDRGEDKFPEYIAAGHRMALPMPKLDAEAIVDACREKWQFEFDAEHPEEFCALTPTVDATQDGWVIASKFNIADVVDVWLALADSNATSLYALKLTLPAGITVGAAYRRVNDQLGVYSAELNLGEIIPPLQFGVATLKLPSIRAEVFTDGGWLIDLGYPWDHDFRNSFQLEVAIFLGSGGIYLGYTAAAAAKLLLLDQPVAGFDLPDPNYSYLNRVRAVRIGMAMRVGIGRSIDLGVLKGEASLTLYGTLEGVAAFRPSAAEGEPPSNEDQTRLLAFGIRGTTGLMVHIWAELDFVVLQARAELKVYVEFGFELRRVIARQGDDHYSLDLPFKVFAEVGIYVHFEVWVTIGCVKVKLFDLTFSTKWRIEETFGSVERSDQPLPRSSNAKHSHESLLPSPRPRALRKAELWTWPPPPVEPVETLTIHVIALPTAADPQDLGLPSEDKYEACMVGQLMLRIGSDFRALAEYQMRWLLTPRSEGADSVVDHATVIAARKVLSKKSEWVGRADVVFDAIRAKFAIELVTVPDQPLEVIAGEAKDASRFVPVPAWPGVTMNLLHEASPLPKVLRGSGTAFKKVNERVVNAADDAFIDFVRLVSETFLAEIDRIIEAQPAVDAELKPRTMKWGALWDTLMKPPNN